MARRLFTEFDPWLGVALDEAASLYQDLFKATSSSVLLPRQVEQVLDAVAKSSRSIRRPDSANQESDPRPRLIRGARTLPHLQGGRHGRIVYALWPLLQVDGNGPSSWAGDLGDRRTFGSSEAAGLVHLFRRKPEVAPEWFRATGDAGKAFFRKTQGDLQEGDKGYSYWRRPTTGAPPTRFTQECRPCCWRTLSRQAKENVLSYGSVTRSLMQRRRPSASSPRPPDPSHAGARVRALRTAREDVDTALAIQDRLVRFSESVERMPAPS